MKLHHLEKMTDFPFLNLFRAAYKDRKNNDKQWIFASRDRAEHQLKAPAESPDAVVIVPYHTIEKKLVLIREFRFALGDYQYGFPAGLLDPGESVEAAGKRELFEETGLEVTEEMTVSPALFTSSGLTDESVSLFFVACDGKPSTAYNEASEDIEVVMVSQQEAGRLLENRDLMFDIKTWIVLNTFAAHGII